MGKRKSAKPQKYIQQSDEEDEDRLDFYDIENESENKKCLVNQKSCSNNNNNNAYSPTDEFEKSAIINEQPNPVSENDVWSTQLSDNSKLLLGKSADHELPHRSSLSLKQPHPAFSDSLFATQAFSDELLSDGGNKNISTLNLSGTESDRMHEFEEDHRGMRTKRRRKYVTYPATFRLEVVEHAEKNGKSAAAKKYNICVEKVSMWCKTKDNIVHRVKKGGFSMSDGMNSESYDDKMDELSTMSLSNTPFDFSSMKVDDLDMSDKNSFELSKQIQMMYNDEEEEEEESDADSEKCDDATRSQEVVYPPYFKLRVIRSAEEKGEAAAAKEFKVCEDRVHLWCQAKEVAIEQVSKQPAENWECDLYIRLKKEINQNHRVTVRDFRLWGDLIQTSNPGTIACTLNTAWLTCWCQRFKVFFKSQQHSIPPPLTDDSYLMLETSYYLVDKEEAHAVIAKSKKTKIQDLIEESKKTDASPSTSDREDSFSFTSSNKRRRRSYTLAFKLEVVKFAQSHTKHATSRKYGIARRVISRWVADREVLENDLLHATQHVLGDSKLTEHVDSQLLKWYKDLKKKGTRVSKSMLCSRADNLFASLGLTNVSASNGWYRHWVLKWKELGEDLHIVDDDLKKQAQLSSFSNKSVNATIPIKTADLLSMNSMQGSSLDALKQAQLTNAILNSMQSKNPDWKMVTHFPELMNAIHSTQSTNLSMNLANQMAAAAAAAAANTNLFQGCNSSSLQAVANYCREQDLSLNSLSSLRGQPSEAGNGSDKSNSNNSTKSSQAKKRRERYSPEFKLAVIEYATNHSYQETSRKFGVHHITVSEWCKDKERIRRKVYCESLHSKILKSETAEQKFLAWLQECNRQKIVIRPADVQSKASEILGQVGETEVKKNCWWFYLWNKRGMDTDPPPPLFEEEPPDSDLLERESRVNYPPAVKIEIAKIAERQSVNSAARSFRVARKRIREWLKTKEKLSWLAETGQVRERSSSLSGRKVNCYDADKEVYEWFRKYNTPTAKPKFSEVRSKALEIFQNYGFNNMKCTRGWYKNWCKRYSIRSNSEKDDTLIKWVLTRYDENLPVTEHELLKFVSSISDKSNSTGLTLAGYNKAFCRRFPKLFEMLPSISETLPEEMETEVEKFRDSTQELQEENSFSLLAVGCMDEVPISFVISGDENKVILNSGMDTCDVVVIMSCLADGTLLPPLIVLKKQELPDEVTDTSFVLYKDMPLVDDSTLKTWLEKVWMSSVPSPSLLVMDCFKPHTSPSIQEAMLESGVTPLVMPKGCASKLQPLHVSVVKSFQYCIQDTWNRSKTQGDKPASLTIPTQVEMVRWITDAYVKLQYQREIVRRSFVMTGISIALDGSEDGLVDNVEWFGGSDRERVLSPLSTTGEDSEPET